MERIGKNKENGITLIALVITIIILLILTGIGISALTQTGLFEKAKIAVNKHKIGQIEEQIELAKYELAMSSEKKTLKDILIENEIITDEQSKEGIININEDIIFITNYAGLKELSERTENGEDFLNKKVFILNDIDSQNSIDVENAELLNGESFKPIVSFSGLFDGNNYSIKNLYIKSEESGAALISKLNKDGTVKNLSIDNSYIEGNGVTGAIIGQNEGTITDCMNKGKIVSKGKLCGGICGWNLNGKIINCNNYGKIIGNKQVGGIAGDSQGTTNYIASVENCTNYGEVDEEYNKDQMGEIAGIIGCNYKYSVINGCINKAKINGSTSYIGGIAGTNYYNIKKCSNEGKIEVTRPEVISKLYLVGGICGMSHGNIEECGNLGDVISNYNTADSNDGAYVGGICGGLSLAGVKDSIFEKISITKSYNYGKINGYKWIGGIAGRINVNSSIESCYNNGDVIAKDRAGGICGTVPNTNTKVLNCYNKGEITSDGYVGGITGISDCYVENSYSTGKINYNGASIKYGMVFGGLWANSTTLNCFYVEENGIGGVGEDKTDELAKTIIAKTSKELKELAGTLGDAYMQDDNVNDGYPYLKDNKPIR